MLICSVSIRPPARTILAELVEAIAATDATATGQVVLATFVDDPADVREIVDAYLGEIMLEAASASDNVSVGLEYAAGIDATITAIDAVDGTVGVISTRSAMVAGPWPVFINPGASREANAHGIMINLA